MNMSIMEKPGSGQPAEIRVLKLLDENSFSELEAFQREAAVITGYGTVNSKLVFVYSQYGPVSLKHAKKIANLYRAALKMGAPVIGIMDSKGLDMNEGLTALEAYGMIMTVQTEAAGVIPQISLVLGDCMGTSALIPQLSDFVIMPAKSARLFMQSPNTYTDASKISFDEVAGAVYNSKKTGIVSLVCDNEDLCLSKTKDLLSYLPSNNLEQCPVYGSSDDLNRTDEGLNNWFAQKDLPPVSSLANLLCDNMESLEVYSAYGSGVSVLLGRFNGYTAGIVATQGLIDNAGLQKAQKFAAFCDSFSIPIVNLINIQGYKVSSAHSGSFMEKTASLISTFAGASVPKINVILKAAIGSGYFIMNSKHLGADVVYAWPEASISLMDGQAAEKIMAMPGGTGLDEAAGNGYVDEIIEPAATRKRIIAALEMLSSKRASMGMFI